MTINMKIFLIIVSILFIKQNESVTSISVIKKNMMPMKIDLHLYLRALERIIESAGTPRNKIDANFGMGLFFANVNLKSAIWLRNDTLSQSLLKQINQILDKNQVLMSFFKYMRMYKYFNHEMTYLFTDEHTWAQRLRAFRPVTDHDLDDRSKEYLEEEYSQWRIYERRIFDFENSVPTPEQSDSCMISLASNPQKPEGRPLYKCSTTDECLVYVENGSEFGYAVIHRVLFLLMAHYAKGCYAFSPQLDYAFVERLCTTIFDEANYIALNKFKAADLLMEQISVCSLAGHAKFLRREWLARLLKQQTSYGCFSSTVMTVYNSMISFRAGNSSCDSHFNSVAAAALSAASRYIIETYY